MLFWGAMRQDAECEPIGVRRSFRETCFAPTNDKIREILAGFLREAGIARAKKVFTASHKITSARDVCLMRARSRQVQLLRTK